MELKDIGQASCPRESISLPGWICADVMVLTSDLPDIGRLNIASVNLLEDGGHNLPMGVEQMVDHCFQIGTPLKLGCDDNSHYSVWASMDIHKRAADIKRKKHANYQERDQG